MVERAKPGALVGIITRSDLLSALRQRMEGEELAEHHVDVRRFMPGSSRDRT